MTAMQVHVGRGLDLSQIATLHSVQPVDLADSPWIDAQSTLRAAQSAIHALRPTHLDHVLMLFGWITEGPLANSSKLEHNAVYYFSERGCDN